jgi:cytochrome P450
MWVFFALAKHPKVRTRLQGDIASFKAQAKTGCPEYLECFLKETLRRYPVAGNTTVRTVTEPHAELTGGAKVAQGTPLHLHIWSLQNTKREWDKPKEFLPDRWIDIVETTDDDGEKTIAYPKCPFSAGDTNVYNGAGHTEGSLSFLPFSAGERSCLGQTMVLSVLREVLLSMDDLRLDFVDKVWAEDLGISQNAIVIPQLPQSRTFRVFRGSAVAEDKVDEGWADEDE